VTERTRIIIPHRGLAASKTRLAPVLSPEERMALGARLLRRVLAVARQAADDVVVISPSAALAELVEAAGARLSVQRGLGLNAGLDQARREALSDGVEVLLVIHGDLPNLQAGDVDALLAACPLPSGVAIAPDRAGTGTNGLCLRPPGIIGFAFGEGSFARHRAEAEAAAAPLEVVHAPGLAFDLDTPADLARWLELGDVA
jgi:2-phospho-L-lactate/phosphoenolpyruvate guanylyltransferase